MHPLIPGTAKILPKTEIKFIFWKNVVRIEFPYPFINDKTTQGSWRNALLNLLIDVKPPTTYQTSIWNKYLLLSF